jgi:hypothetical protein
VPVEEVNVAAIRFFYLWQSINFQFWRLFRLPDGFQAGKLSKPPFLNTGFNT